MELTRWAELHAAELVRQPFSGTDAGAFVLVVLAVSFALQWRRDREPGLHWLAAGTGLLALWMAATPLHVPSDPQVRSPAWSALSLTAVGLMVHGLAQYLGTPLRARRWVVPLLVAPLVALVAALLLGRAPPRQVIAAISFITYLGTAALAGWAARREPGVGHAAVGIAVLTLPMTAVAAWALRGDTAVARYLVLPPTVVMLVTLLTTSLVRRRRALEAEVARRQQAEAALTRLNHALEHTVAERTADLQQLVQGLQSFNRSVSHDLRGPLGGIANLTRLALDALQRGEPGRAAALMAPVADQAERSERLVGALLTLAHVGDAELQRQPVDLQALAQRALAELALGQPGLPLDTVHIEALPRVAGDAELLTPVFVNLIGNALKFARAQTAPQVRVGAHRVDGAWVIDVQDNGLGFDAGQARRLFQPFVRLHGTGFEGSGIGLSIVKRAVERHGGQVWAEGQPGEGACFHFSLPDGPDIATLPAAEPA